MNSGIVSGALNPIDFLDNPAFKAIWDVLRELGTGLRRDHILEEADGRIKDDGDYAKIGTVGPYLDKDGVSMNGNQWFLHQSLYAIPRAEFGGFVADKFVRDPHFKSWGMQEADALMAGMTPESGRAALEAVFNRLMEQL